VTENERAADPDPIDRPDSLRRLRFSVDQDRTAWPDDVVVAVIATLKDRTPRLLDELATVPPSPLRDLLLSTLLAVAINTDRSTS